MSTAVQSQVEELARFLERVTRLNSLSAREDAICCGVTVAQCRILLGLAAAGKVAMKDLSHRLGIAPSTLTRNIEPLVAKGWAVREPSEADRRQVVVSLSHEGREKAAELKGHQIAFCGRLLEGLTAPERERLLGSLNVFLSVLEKEAHQQCCPEALGTEGP